MKLFIDDIRRCPQGWEVARNVTEAIRIIATQNVGEISIDHDSSHGTNENTSTEVSCPCDFTAVAYFIGEKCQNNFINPKITVHSVNPDGAKRIKNILQHYGLKSQYIPYSQ